MIILQTNLFMLNLGSNQFTSYERNSFTTLKNLQYIYLNNNKISSLLSDTFSNQTLLNSLDLSSNQLTSISPQTFTSINNVRSISINLNCNPLLNFNSTNKQTKLCGPNYAHNLCSVCFNNWGSLPNCYCQTCLTFLSFRRRNMLINLANFFIKIYWNFFLVIFLEKTLFYKRIYLITNKLF